MDLKKADPLPRRHRDTEKTTICRKISGHHRGDWYIQEFSLFFQLCASESLWASTKTDGLKPRLLPGPGKYRSTKSRSPIPWLYSARRANPPCAVSSSSVLSILNPNTVCRIMFSPCRLKDLSRVLSFILAFEAADKVFFFPSYFSISVLVSNFVTPT